MEHRTSRTGPPHRGPLVIALAATLLAALVLLLLLGAKAAGQSPSPDAAPAAGVAPDPVPQAAAPAPGPVRRAPASAPVVVRSVPAPAAATPARATTQRAAPAGPASTRARTVRRRRGAPRHVSRPVHPIVQAPPTWAVFVPSAPASARPSSDGRLAGAGAALLLLALASGALIVLVARADRLRPGA
ncbi:MAG: hypothetical protein ACXVFT_15340 [Solirubrobacteraceae bacterium]